MRRAFASALFATVLAMPFGVRAEDPQPRLPSFQEAAPAVQPKGDAASKKDSASAGAKEGATAALSPVAITAKRTHLDLRLTNDRLNRVLSDSGVEPVPESDADVEVVEVSAQRVRQEPIAQGIPALYYGITHPTEAWRIFAPIQP